MTKHPLELRRGDVIAEHPRDHAPGRWPVVGPPVRFEDVAEIPIAGGLWLTAHLGDEVVLAVTPCRGLAARLRAIADRLDGAA